MQLLSEDLLLLALDNDKGTVSWQSSTTIPYGLGGALLMDLALRERIDVVDKKIVVGDPSPTGDELLDTALETIRAADKPHDARHWVTKLGVRTGLREQLAHRLVARGILREQEHTFLWVFHDPRFPTSDAGPESAVRDRIRDVALAGAEPDPDTLLLVSLVHACNLLDGLFAREERTHARRRIKELVEGDQFGEAVGRAVADVAVAAMAAVTAGAFTVAVASGASH